jgi:hypothetical protein
MRSLVDYLVVTEDLLTKCYLCIYVFIYLFIYLFIYSIVNILEPLTRLGNT